MTMIDYRRLRSLKARNVVSALIRDGFDDILRLKLLKLGAMFELNGFSYQITKAMDEDA